MQLRGCCTVKGGLLTAFRSGDPKPKWVDIVGDAHKQHVTHANVAAPHALCFGSALPGFPKQVCLCKGLAPNIP